MATDLRVKLSSSLSGVTHRGGWFYIGTALPSKSQSPRHQIPGWCGSSFKPGTAAKDKATTLVSHTRWCSLRCDSLFSSFMVPPRHDHEGSRLANRDTAATWCHTPAERHTQTLPLTEGAVFSACSKRRRRKLEPMLGATKSTSRFGTRCGHPYSQSKRSYDGLLKSLGACPCKTRCGVLRSDQYLSALTTTRLDVSVAWYWALLTPSAPRPCQSAPGEIR